MGTKTITTTETQTVHVCDRCGKPIDLWWACLVCRREVGCCCSQRVLGYEPGQPGVINLAFHVCRDCDEIGRDVTGTPFIDLIRNEVREADARILDVLERCRTWAKERLEKGGAT